MPLFTTRLLLFSLAVLAPAAAPVIFTGGFESGTLSPYRPEGEGDPASRSVAVVTSPHPVAEGRYSARFTLDLPSTTFPIMRNELLAWPYAKPNPGIGMLGQAYTYTFSHFVPTSWPNTALPIEVAQFHVYPDFKSGENWRSPVLAFLIRNRQWDLVNRWDDNVVTTGATTRTINLGNPSLQLGTWTHWRVNVLWSWGDQTKPRGFLKIWKNGQLVVDRTGPNCYNDQFPRTFKWGLYTRAHWTGQSFPVAQYELFTDGFTVELSGSEAPAPPTRLRIIR